MVQNLIVIAVILISIVSVGLVFSQKIRNNLFWLLIVLFYFVTFWSILFVKAIHENLHNLLINDKVLSYLVAQNVAVDCTKTGYCHQDYESLLSLAVEERIKQTNSEAFYVTTLNLENNWLSYNNSNLNLNNTQQIQIESIIFNAKKQTSIQQK